MSEPVVIKLRSPIQLGSRRLDEITVRPVKAKHLRSIQGAGNDLLQTLDLASKLTGEPKEVIDELEGEDLGEVLAAVNGFLFVIQGTGKTSSAP